MRFLSILILIIDILVISDILKTQHATEKKFLWILTVLLLPVVGPIMYFLFARKG